MHEMETARDAAAISENRPTANNARVTTGRCPDTAARTAKFWKKQTRSTHYDSAHKRRRAFMHRLLIAGTALAVMSSAAYAQTAPDAGAPAPGATQPGMASPQSTPAPDAAAPAPAPAPDASAPAPADPNATEPTDTGKSKKKHKPH